MQTENASAFKKIRQVGEFIRISHVVFAMPFALISLLVAVQGFPSFSLFVKIVLAVFFARNTAMTFNRLADLRYDRENPRTQTRHLVIGSLTPGFAWLFLAGNALLFFLVCLAFNRLTAWLAFPTLAVLLFYSVTKRFTAGSHFFLGLALGIAPMGAWVAATGHLAWAPLALALAVFFWVAGFDMIYATQDEHFDRAAGLHSIVVRLGRGKALWVARACHALVVPALLCFGFLSNPLGFFFFSACAIIFGLLMFEHILVRPDGDLRRVNDAFFRVNGLISLLLLIATVLDLYPSKH